MAEELKNPGIAARATIIESTGTLTKEQKLAKQLQEQVTKDKAENPKSALEGLKKKMGVSDEKVNDTLEQAIGTERDPATGKKVLHGPEITRRDDVQKSVDSTRKYIDKGLAGLTLAEQMGMADKLANIINSWEQGREIFKGMDPGQRRTVALAMLQRPDMAPFISDALNNSLGRLPTEIDKGLSDRFKAAEGDKTEKETKHTKLETDRKTAEAEIKKFTDTTNPDFAAKGQKLNELKGKIASWDRTEREASQRISGFDRQLDRLENQKMGIDINRARVVANGEDPDKIIEGIDKQIEALEIKKGAEEDKRIEITNEKRDYQALMEERTRAEASEKQLQEKVDVAKEAWDKAEKDFSLVNADMNLAKLDRAKAEETFVKGIQNATEEGMLEYLVKTTEAHEKAADAVIDKQKSEAKDKADLAIDEAMMKRWNETKVFRRLWWSSEVREPKRDQIRTDMGNVLNEPVTGPKDLMGTIMADAGVPPDIIAEKLKDQTWVDANQPQVMERLAARAIQIGRLKQGDFRTIADTKWGKGLIDKAINQNKEVRAQIDRGIANGSIRSDFMETLHKTQNKDIIAAILGILSGAIGATVAAPVLAATMGAATAGGAEGGFRLAGR